MQMRLHDPDVTPINIHTHPYNIYVFLNENLYINFNIEKIYINVFHCLGVYHNYNPLNIHQQTKKYTNIKAHTHTHDPTHRTQMPNRL